jgi:hypothetical protein
VPASTWVDHHKNFHWYGMGVYERLQTWHSNSTGKWKKTELQGQASAADTPGVQQRPGQQTVMAHWPHFQWRPVNE